VYAWWQRSRHPAAVSAMVQTAQPPTASVQPPASVPPVAAASVDAADRQSAANPPAEPAAPQAAAQQPAAQQPASPKPLAQQTAPPAPEQAAQAPAPSDPNAPVRVEVTAEEAVWIRVEKDGKYVFSGTLEANQTRTVDASDKVLLKVGNAGGVSIVLNGKPVQNLGPKGQVRTVQFTSGGFEIIPAAKPAAPVEPFL
jgi:cytoskeleton protein RodZ